jgi:hypothetical protein
MHVANDFSNAAVALPGAHRVRPHARRAAPALSRPAPRAERVDRRCLRLLAHVGAPRALARAGLARTLGRGRREALAPGARYQRCGAPMRSARVERLEQGQSPANAGIDRSLPY